MKNIHVLQTDKPSRLACDFDKLILNSRLLSPILYKTQNIYITSDEEIKEGYYYDLTHNIVMKSIFYQSSDKNCKKIILTTDQDLIKDGVQAIDDEFLEWFVQNPSCESVLVTNLYGDFNPIEYFYEIIIPKEEHKQETTLEEAAERFTYTDMLSWENTLSKASFIAGAKWQQERSYSEDDLEIAFKNGFVISYGINDIDSIDRKDELFKEWLEYFKTK